MKTKLKNCINFTTGLIFDLLQCFNIPWIQYNRLFTDRFSLMTQSKSDMRIMKIIRRTNAYIINLGSCPFKFVKMPVEPFKFYKKITFREITINSPDTVKLIKTCQEVVACFLYGIKMSYSYITCNTDYPEIFWRFCHTHMVKRRTKILKYFRNFAILNLVSLSTLGTGSKSGSIEIKFMPVFTHPAGLPGSITNNQSIWFNIFCNNCASSDE